MPTTYNNMQVIDICSLQVDTFILLICLIIKSSRLRLLTRIIINATNLYSRVMTRRKKSFPLVEYDERIRVRGYVNIIKLST